ncbi:MAG: cation:proton antiporter [Proteobacteria bacterium]|nr:cation:proton antiporter [Pseudomonadota bacterium]
MADLPPVDKLREVVLFLGTAGVVIPLVKRLNLSPTLGFLLAGIVLGPFVMGRMAEDYPLLQYITFGDAKEMAHVGEFGVVFLFFMIGLELSLDRLRILRRMVLRFGAWQFLLSTAVVGLVTWLWGARPIASLVVGAALAMSSTAIIIPTLAERKKLGTAAGRTTFAVLLFQDLAVTPLLVMLTLLSGGPDGATDPTGALGTLLQAAVGLFLMIFVGRLVLRPLFQMVAIAQDQEFFMAASLLVVIGAAAVAQLAGLSMAIGAFVGGLLLAETEFRRQIEATIDPFRGLLLGLFFIAIGARLDLSLLHDTPLQILVFMAGFVLLKVIVMYALMHSTTMSRQARHEVAWLLAPAGEFAFVLLAQGMETGLVWPSLGGKLLVAVTLSMFAIPIIALVLDRMERTNALDDRPYDTVEAGEDDAQVVIIGSGRVGTMVAEMLARHKVPAISVDMNQRNVALARSEGHRAFYGDPTVPQFMDRLPLDTARALVLTLSNPAAVEAILAMARRRFPDLTIVARARDRQHASKLYELGVTDAVPETFEASLQLAEAVLVDVGVPMGLVIASVHDKRDRTRRRLKAVPDDAREAATSVPNPAKPGE